MFVFVAIAFVGVYTVVAFDASPRFSAIYSNRKYSRLNLADTSSVIPQQDSFFSKLKVLLEQFLSPPAQTLLKDSYLASTQIPEIPKIDYTIYDSEISDAKSILVEASLTKSTDPMKVIESLVNLEKLMRAKNKLDEGVTSRETLSNLNGEWRLIFSTGTVNVQKKVGKVNYFPIKAVQSFNTSVDPFKISNGIYIGDFELLKFYGNFVWLEKARKLEFDFDEIGLFGAFKFTLPSGGAAKIGSSTGLGAERKQTQRKPFFNWISADEEIATARGGGGGLALWRRVV